MKIAHIDTERTWRGGQQQVLYLIDGCKSRGLDVHLIATPQSPLASRATNHGHKILEVAHHGEWDIYSAYQVRKFLHQKKIDVVHAHSAHGAALAALATWNTNIPFVITRRVDFPLKKNIFSQWKYKQSAHVIAISRAIEEILLKGGIQPGKCSIIPSGIDLARFKNVQPVNKNDLNVPPHAIVIGQIAALADHKDQFTFIKMISVLRKTIPHIYGVIVGEGNMRSELEKFANNLDMSSRIKLLGFKANPLEYLAAFDVFCLTSKEEGLGTSILDAMALKIPIVATKAGGIPEIIEHNLSGLLARIQNEAEIAEEITKILNNSDLKNKLIEGGLRRVNQFHVDNTVDKTIAIYEGISKKRI